jgi:hypothetical protein
MSSRCRLSDAISELTEEINRTGAAPPAAAGMDPLMELLIHDARGRLPEALRRRLDEAADPCAAADWLGVGKLYEALPAKADGGAFLNAVGDDPARAAAAWAKLVSPFGPPPEPTEGERDADAAGAVLQTALIGALLGVRCAMVFLFAAPAGLYWPARALAAAGLVPLLASHPAIWSRPFWGLELACAWMALELWRAPRWMAAARRLAFRALGETPFGAGRAEALHSFWRVQAALLLAACAWRLFV